MSKVAGILFAAAMVLPIGLVASPAGAGGGTVCKTAGGTATFSPALPILTSKATVKDKLTAIGTLGQCSGGGVTTAHTLFVTPVGKTGSNCTTLITYNPKAAPTTGTETITWNTGKTSTVALELHQVKGHSTETSVTGTVTAGLFKGLGQTGTLIYTAEKNGCTKIPLASVTYKQVTTAAI